ncbi:hypothetical protein [Raoultella sp. 18111]|uniref:hypothetical protein n=1 Tax=unclassified Raoultella TaxID=2627600 RepID=UPI0034CFB84B
MVSRTANIHSYLLSDSEFGLWFRHKCSQHLGRQPEIEQINLLIEAIDDMLKKVRIPAETSWTLFSPC